MKKIAIKTLVLSLAVIAAMGCTSDYNYKDYDVTASKGLTYPDNDYYIELQPGDGNYVHFEWQAAGTVNGVLPTYVLVFFKTKGGEEVYRYDAGLNTSVNISHKVMNKIGDAAGIDPELVGGGEMYWSVVTSLGIVETQSEDVRRLFLKRLDGFSLIPDMLYFTGPASEAPERDLDRLPMKYLGEEGEFEIYTEITNNDGGVYFVDDEGNTYTYSNRLMEYGTEPITSMTPGQYRIKVDMTTKSIKWTRITQVQYCMQHMLSENTNLEYAGDGVWTMRKIIRFAPADWGEDERFRFNVTVEGESYAQEIWGQFEKDRPVRPESLANEPANFWYVLVQERPSDNYMYCWKFTTECKDRELTINVRMSPSEENYRVEIVL